MALPTYHRDPQPSPSGLYGAHLTDQSGAVVCSAGFLYDGEGNTVVIDIATPEALRGQGYAKTLLGDLRRLETPKALRVVSTEHAVGFYRKLGYQEIAPYVFQA